MPKIFLIALLLMCSTFVTSITKWRMNFTTGLSYVPPVPLWVMQENFRTINTWANYESAPLKLPPYYSARPGFENDQRGWELEINHLKVYLKNKPSEIDRFSISHGYNQLTVNFLNKDGRFNSKTGFDVVAAHPENSVRGKKLDKNGGFFKNGYYIAGPVVQYGVFKEISVTKYFYLLGEIPVSAAYARVPVVNGKAHAPVVALHLQIGPGFRL